MDHQPIFHNFDLHISMAHDESPAIDVYELAVQQSLAGETQHPVKIQIYLDELSIQQALSELEYRDISTQRLIDFGISLAKWLLPPGPIRNLYQRSLGIAEADGQGLRLRLRIDPPELASLPWEYMYDESTREFIALNPKIALVRYHNLPISRVELVQQTSVSILVMMSEPIGTNILPNGRKELSNLLQALKDLREQRNVEVDILYGGGSRQKILEEVQREQDVKLLKETLSVDTFRRALRRTSYHIVHYIGHSIFDDELGGLLLLTDQNDNIAMVDASRFAREMRGTNTAAVILNACQSAQDGDTRAFMGLAPRLIQAGIPAVIAMQYAIPAQAAMRFSGALYQALADSQPLDAATVEGRLALTPMTSTECSTDWGIPVLFMRSDGVVWTPDIIQHDQIQAGLQKFAQQTETSAHQDQPPALIQGIHRYVNHLKEESAQSSTGGPYRGLLTYRLGDADIFFGRERGLSQLLNRLNRSSLTILHAESGAGKSSLLQAGLEPHLIVQRHLPILLRRYNLSPTLVLKNFLLTNLEDEPDIVAESLREFLHRISEILGSQTKLYIILDQFEDFFILLDKTTQSEFIHELADCLEDRTLNAHWLLSLRSEYFSELANFHPHISNPLANNHRLNRMSEEQAYMVIDKPAACYGIKFEEGLISLLINDLNLVSEQTTKLKVEPEEGVIPSQLQLVCLALYEALEPDQTIIDYNLYIKSGGVAGILKGHLDRVLRRGLPADQRGTARFLLEALVSSHTRRVTRTRTELILELGSYNIEQTIIDRVLDQMVDERLLHVTDNHEEVEPLYELAHDYLIKEIELSTEVKSRKASQELLEREILNWQYFDTLIGPRSLEIIRLQRPLLYFDDIAAELLIRSALRTGTEIDIWFQIASPELIRQVLLDSLVSSEEHSRACAITYLADYYDDQVEQNLVNLVSGSTSPQVYKAILTTLSSCGSSSARQIALDNLKNAQASIRTHSASTLESFSDSEVQQALLTSVITDEDRATWVQSMIALNAQRGDTSFWDSLLQAPLKRQSAIYNEVTSNKTFVLPPQIKNRLLLSYLGHKIYLQILSHPLISLISTLVAILLFISAGGYVRDIQLDKKWERLGEGEFFSVKLSDVSTTRNQILVSSYDYGAGGFYAGSWKTDFLNEFPECSQGHETTDPTASKCTIWKIEGSNMELNGNFYALTSIGLYRYESQNSMWIRTQQQDEEGMIIPVGLQPLCLPLIVLSVCEPLAVYGDKLLLLVEDQKGIWVSENQGEEWNNLRDRGSPFAQEFRVVTFDQNGVPYAGGRGGLYRGSKNNFWVWDRVMIDHTQGITRSVKQMSIGSLKSTDGLLEPLYLVTANQNNENEQIGCYKATGEPIDSSLQPLPITNFIFGRILPSQLMPIRIEAIVSHPYKEEFYIADNYGAIYAMDCNGKRSKIGQKSSDSTNRLAIWSDDTNIYLLWANHSGLFQYQLDKP